MCVLSFIQAVLVVYPQWELTRWLPGVEMMEENEERSDHQELNLQGLSLHERDPGSMKGDTGTDSFRLASVLLLTLLHTAHELNDGQRLPAAHSRYAARAWVVRICQQASD